MRDEFENILKERIGGQEAQAPDVFSQILAQRTPFHIFKNKLYLNRYRILGAAAILVIIALFLLPNTRDEVINPTDKEYNVENNSLNQGNAIDEISSTEIVQDSKNQSRNEDIVESEYSEEGGSVEQTPSTPEANNIVADNSGSSSQANNNFVGADRGSKDSDNTTFKHSSEDASPIERMVTPEVDDTSFDNVVKTENSQADESNPENTEKVTNPIVNDVNGDSDENKGVVRDQSAAKDAVEDGDSDIIEAVTEDVPADSDENFSQSDEVIASEDNDESGNDESEEGLIDIESTTTDIPAPNNAPIKNFSIQLSGGPFVGDRVLKGDYDSRKLRDETEKRQIAYSFGAVLNKEFGNHFEFFTGFEYTQRNEEMTHAHSSTSLEEIIQTKRVKVLDPIEGEKWIDVEYSEWVEKEIEHKFNSQNMYKRVVVPVGLRYNLYKNRWSFGPSMALGLQVWNKNTGSIMVSNLEVESLEEGSFGTNPMSLETRIAFGGTYRLNQRLSLLVEPSMKYFINPVSGSSYVLKQQDYGIDIDFGLKFKF